MKSVRQQEAPQAYMIRQHSPNPDYRTRLIASKIKEDLSPRMLEPNRVLLLQLPHKQYVWQVIRRLTIQGTVLRSHHPPFCLSLPSMRGSCRGSAHLGGHLDRGVVRCEEGVVLVTLPS